MNEAVAEAALPVTTDAQAERVVRYMFERDTASRGIGMKLESAGLGRACVSMIVRTDMLNGHGNCHGGFIYTLADSAFQFACNSRNEATVAVGGAIEYLRASLAGDRLQAQAVETSLVGRSSVYDITVTNQAGEVLALFRGKSRRVRGSVMPEDDNS